MCVCVFLFSKIKPNGRFPTLLNLQNAFRMSLCFERGETKALGTEAERRCLANLAALVNYQTIGILSKQKLACFPQQLWTCFILFRTRHDLCPFLPSEATDALANLLNYAPSKKPTVSPPPPRAVSRAVSLLAAARCCAARRKRLTRSRGPSESSA